MAILRKCLFHWHNILLNDYLLKLSIFYYSCTLLMDEIFLVYFTSVKFRLEVPAEFQDVEDSVANRPEVKQLEDQEAATKKRFLSRYRNQSGLPSKEQKG